MNRQAESTRQSKDLAGSRVLPRDVPDAASSREPSPARLCSSVQVVFD
jgi:hypothetical protein